MYKILFLLLMVPFSQFQDSKYFYLETKFSTGTNLPNRYNQNKIIFLVDKKVKNTAFLNEFQERFFSKMKEKKKEYQFYYLDSINLHSNTLVDLYLESRPNGIMVCKTNGLVTINDPNKTSRFDTKKFITFTMDYHYMNSATFKIKPYYTLNYFIANSIPDQEKESAFNNLEGNILKFLFK